MLLNEQILSRLLGCLYDAAADPDRWETFLHELAGLSGATSAGLLIHDFQHSKYSLSSSWQVRADSLRLYQDHYHALDIWAQKGMDKPSGYICHSQSLCSLKEIRTTEMYNDFMLQAGIEHGMFGVLENNKYCLASISLYRDKRCSEFTESDLRILKFLVPHLQRAFQLHVRFSELKSHSADVEKALDGISTGVVMMDSKGEIVLMNRSAGAIVAERDGLLATGAGLRAERPEETNALAGMIQAAASTSNGSGLSPCATLLITRRTRPPLQLQISPLRTSVIQSSRRMAVMAFIRDPLKRERPTQEVLRALYRLTPAECRVALLMSDGHTSRHIAEMVGVTENTVRTQLKSIFAKTGVKRQAELIKVLSAHVS